MRMRAETIRLGSLSRGNCLQREMMTSAGEGGDVVAFVSDLALVGEDGNGAVEDKVRAEVMEMCGRFPIYPNA